MTQLAAGVKAPDFTLQTLEGRAFRLIESLAAGPVVLAFYKSSCPTCQLTFPYLEKIHSEGPRKMNIVGISQDEPEEARAFASRFGITFDVLIDPHPYDVSQSYGLEFVPAIFVVDAGSVIQLSDYGFSKAALSQITRPLELFRPDDGLPATRPG